MSSPLTKADILRGARGSAEEVEVEGIGLVLLRPLTDGEYQYAQSLTIKALSAMADIDTLQKQVAERKKAGQALDGMTMNLNIGTYSDAEAESRYFVAACALSVKEKWTVEDVKKLAPGIPAKIAEKAYEISHIDPNTPQGGVNNLVKPFRAE